MEVKEIINQMYDLEGKYFSGILNAGGTGVDDSGLPECVVADYLSTFENITKDKFTEEDLIRYNEFIKNKKPLVGEGYEFADYVHPEYTKEDIKDDYINSPKYWLFCSLLITPDKFNGDFKTLKEKIDEYMLEFKKEYDKIKES